MPAEPINFRLGETQLFVTTGAFDRSISNQPANPLIQPAGKGKKKAAESRFKTEGRLQQQTQPNLKTLQGGFTPTLIAKAAYKRNASMPHSKLETIHADVMEKVKEEVKKLKEIHPEEFLQLIIQDTRFQMHGVALVAAHQAAKKGVNGLYVCETLEAFRSKLEKISQAKEDARCALIVPTDGTAHKIAVCVEKRGDAMKVAILETLGVDDDDIDAIKVTSPTTKIESLSFVEEILWNIYNSKINLKNTQIYGTFEEKQVTGYACETFSIRSGMAFLKNPKFFDEIVTKKIVIENQVETAAEGSIEVENVVLEEKSAKIELFDIKVLPPEFMLGTQSPETLLIYLGAHLKSFLKDPVKNKQMILKMQSFMQRIAKHTIPVEGDEQNHYINERSDKYFLLAIELLKTKSRAELQAMIDQTLISV